MGTAATDILNRLQPVERAYPDDNGILSALVTALMAPTQIVDDVARDTDTVAAWGTIRDPDTAPAEFLPWLANFPGVVFPPNATEAEQRDRLKRNPGFDDGKTSALEAEVARTLTGAQAVRVLTHVSGDPWLMTVVTRTAETPDAAATLAAAMRQKPAGVELTHAISDFALIADWTRTIDTTTELIDDLELTDVT